MKKVAYIFPGQGVLPKEITRLPYWQRERFRQTFEEASEVLGVNLLDIFVQPQKRALLAEGVIARPSVVTFNVACLKVLDEHTHLTPVVVAGHSVGEYSALVAAGALQLTDAVKAAQEIAALIQRYFPNGSGSMAAIVGLQPMVVEELCHEVSQKEFV
ncbi:MAG: ACP S-malonyltransferase, partial [Calditrichaeota bacterium]